jgi:lipoprotein-anchoring transpeptidase ErfK/SrfK
MKHHTRRFLALVAVVLLGLAAFLLPDSLFANRAPQGDFVAPMSPREAQARVAAAQAADAQQRAGLLASLPPTAASELPIVQTVYVAQTNHHLSNRAGFLTWWLEHGGVMIFGYPISDEIVENGRMVQYFERARFEYHPEAANPDERIQLSLLGREITAGRTFPPAGPEAGEVFFPETSHTLSGVFLRFWQKRGGIPIFGFPISEPMDEVSPADGQTYQVQYFERARFEYHPDELGAFYRAQVQAYGLRLDALHEISLGDLGRQAAQAKNYAFAQDTRVAGAPEWSPALWPRRIDVDLTTQHLTAYEGSTPVYTAPVATGKNGFETPTGTFAIYSRAPMETMTGSAGGETWYVPDIPWVQYVVGGVALHGTYWHDQWGTGFRLSHGCINLNIDDAQWLYEWADIGTPVEIHY